MHLRQRPDFVRFSAANEQRSIWRFSLAGQPCYRNETCSFSQQAKLFQLAIKMWQTEVHPH